MSKEIQTKKIWFKRKTYGYGWVPASAEGWTVTLLFVAIIVACALVFEDRPDVYSILIVANAIVLVAICYKKGEKPRWQWGEKDKETSE